MNTTIDTLPTTRKEAKAIGSLHYSTGKPCIHGHIAPRFTSICSCMECNRIASRKRRIAAAAEIPSAAALRLTLVNVIPSDIGSLLSQLVAQGVTTVHVEVRQ